MSKARRQTVVTDGIDFDKVNVNEMLERTGTGEHRGGVKCWAYGVDGKLKEFLDGCSERIKQGKPFRMSLALEQAQMFLGVNVRISAFRNHVLGRCSCRERENSER